MKTATDSNSTHILLIEDDKAHQDLVLRAFRDDPELYRLSVAANLREARLITKRDLPDLILADWVLPDGKGLEILMRRDGAVTIPLIIMTSYGDEHLAVEIMKSGAIDYVVKSATMFAELPQIIRRALRDWENIRERERAEEALRESETRFKDLFNNIGAGVAIYEATPDGKDFIIRDVNRAVETIEQVRKDDIIGRRLLDVFPGVAEYGLFAVFQRVAKTGIAESHPVSQYSDNRISGWRENYVYRLPYGEVVAVCEDVTEKKQVEEAEQETRRKYAELFELGSEAIFLIDNEIGVILEANTAACEMYGYSREALLSMKNTDLSAEKEKTRKVTTESPPGTIQIPLRYHRRNDGTVFPVEILGRFFVWNKRPVHIAAIRDITTRMHAEEVLRESETRYRSVVENASEGITIAQDAQLQYANPRLQEMIGARPEEIVGHPFTDFIHPDDRALVLDRYQRRMSGEDVPQNYDFRVLGKNKKITWVQLSAVRIEWNNKPATLNFITDITERKQAEEALRESEQLLGEVFDNANDAIFLLERTPDGPGKYLLVNDKAFRMLGYAKEELMAMSPRDIVPENIAKKIMPGVMNKLLKDGHATFESAHRKKDGSIYPVEVSTHTFRYRGKDVDLSIVRDITERKQAALALVESEIRFRSLIQNSSDIIRILGSDGRIIYESPSSERILGYPSGSLIGLDPMQFVHPDDVDRVKKDLGKVVDRKNPGTPTEFRIRKADGEYLWVDSLGNNLLDVPGVNGIVITTRPIQQKKEAEERMMAAQRLYAVQSRINQAIVHAKDPESLSAEICQITVDHGRFRMSWVGLLDRTTGILRSIADAGDEQGYLAAIEIHSSSDEKGRGPTGTAIREGHYDICNDIEADPRMLPWRDEALKRGYRSSAAFPLQNRGEVVGAYSIYSSEKDFFNPIEIALLEEIAANISFALDMLDEQTLRSQAEQALQKNEARLATAMDIASLVNWEFDVATGMFTFDDRFYTLYETTAEREGGNLMSAETYLQEFVYPDDRPKVLAAIQKILETTDPDYSGQVEHRIIPRDGSVRTIIARYVPVLDPDGKVIRMVGANQDITDFKLMESEIRSLNTVLEQRVKDRTDALVETNEKLEEENAQRLEAEAKLQASYNEKVMLLKEIHHRVKNNLQIIASLLNLQSRYITDESTLAAIRESQTRVKAMALVHERLYRAEDISHISLQDYIRFLGTGLFQFYDAKIRGIQFTLDVHDIEVDIDAAIPLGLIINELISNSLKYAFPEGRKGEIAVSVKKENRTLTVLYRDTGIGIPAELDWKNTPSLGLRLVNTLVDQMNGTVELDRSNGTLFTMVLHEKEPRGQK